MNGKVFTKKSLSAEASLAIVDACIKKALEIGSPSTIAVVDEGGATKALVRMDGAPLISVDVALNKAYTSASSGFDTAGFHAFIKDDSALLNSLPHQPKLAILGGGVPVMVDGAVVGAVGISGGHYTQDIDIANAGVGAIA